jgi:hypothetical protein
MSGGRWYQMRLAAGGSGGRGSRRQQLGGGHVSQLRLLPALDHFCCVLTLLLHVAYDDGDIFPVWGYSRDQKALPNGVYSVSGTKV